MNNKNKWSAVLSIISVIFVISAAIMFFYAILNSQVDNELFMSIIFVLVGFGYLFNSIVRLKEPAYQNNRFNPSWYYFNIGISVILIVGSVIRIFFIIS